MQTTQEITNALKAQFDAIATRLAATDKERAATLAMYEEQRKAILAEAAPLANALKALGFQVAGFTATAGVRRPMSQEAKDRIREGLRKAAERKRLAATAPAAQQELLAPVAAPSTPTKAARRG